VNGSFQCRSVIALDDSMSVENEWHAGVAKLANPVGWIEPSRQTSQQGGL